MDRTEYLRIIQDAKRLDRRLFDLSSIENIERLEGILDVLTREQGETIIGVPLVQPYGGPTDRYVALPERVYWELRNSLASREIETIYPEVGVPYDKKRFDIIRKQITKGYTIPQTYLDFMEKIRTTAEKIEVYQKPYFSHS